MSKKGCGRKKKLMEGERRVGGEKEKGRNPYVVIFCKQKEWKEVFCQILNGKQGEGDIEDETRERVDLQ